MSRIADVKAAAGALALYRVGDVITLEDDTQLKLHSDGWALLRGLWWEWSGTFTDREVAERVGHAFTWGFKFKRQEVAVAAL